MRNGLELYERTFITPWSLMERMSEDLRTESPSREWFDTRTDVQESENGFLLSVDLPGVRKEDVTIDLKGRVLTIAGQRKQHRESNDGGMTRAAAAYGKYSRTFTLPESVDVEKIEANLEDGVLHVALPKAAAAKPRSIQIENAKPGFFAKLLGREETTTPN